jgi:hypothetical protein
MKNNDLKDYQNYIDNLSSTKSSEIFLNSSSEHAVIIMSNIFKTAKEEALILAGDLLGGISNQKLYWVELIKFLNRGGKLNILLTKFESNKIPDLFFKIDQDEYADRVKIGILNKPVMDNQGNEVHFTVGDKRSFRFEHDINKFLAFGSFNSNSAKDLASLFLKMQINANSLNLKAVLS